MPLINWTSSLSIGHAEIDNQHKKLVDLINVLFDAMKEGKGNDVLLKVFNEMVAYTTYHFTYEEQVMKKANYPHLQHQHNEHEALKKKVVDMKATFQTSQTQLTITTMNFLRDWLNNHILKEDMKLGKFLQGN